MISQYETFLTFLATSLSFHVIKYVRGKKSRHMKWLDSSIEYLYPKLLVESTPWLAEWEQQQRDQFVRIAIVFLPIVAFGYIANYFFFDVAMGLEPLSFWLTFRLSISALAIMALIFYLSPIVESRYYKIPALIVCSACCITQAWVTHWYSVDAWFFLYLFVFLSAIVLRMNPLATALFAFCILLLGYPILLRASVSQEYIATTSLFTFFSCVILRISAITETRNFLLNQENMSTQRKLNEVNMEYAKRIRSFIPKVIADRLDSYVQQNYSVVDASVEALKAKKTNVACLFTDIRGFTQGSKDLEGFIADSVMPEVTACSGVIEDLGGIPRKVGDLIFAYFDEPSIHRNLIRALRAGIEITQINETMNMSGGTSIVRYILISSGDAIVGNFGGLDSSIEVTALGTPVNYLSRVDDLTKHPLIAKELVGGDLILDTGSVELIQALQIELPFKKICLDSNDLQIRDFPETKEIYRLRPSEDIYSAIVELDRYVDSI